MRSLAPSRLPRCEAGGNAQGGPPKRRPRRVALIVRDVEVARYTLPDFFPDLNARDDATVGLAPLEQAGDARATYRWQRSVLAGVERSTPRQRAQPPQGSAQLPQGSQTQLQPEPPLTAEDALRPGPASVLLAVLTAVFYAAALALTLSRGFVESVPLT